ncbi:MAG TPA: glycine--tRNA ligase [Thermomicrobiales bacterium]|nr:glycine--tRNA ligase [Thermomicrobiales bacterium]
MSVRERNAVTMDTIVALCKRRGFIFPSAEIYGGFANAFDYGPLGVELRRNLRDLWWRALVQERDDVVGVEGALITNPRVWVASGHVEGFNDPLVECRNCHARFRADNLPGATIGPGGAVTLPADLACPNCGERGQFTEPRQFNMMFKTDVGVVEEDATVAYLPPETAQAMFINFANVQLTARKKLPFGIAQIRKSFRNEITPGNFIFRTREFEQMELEYFVRPGTEDEWHRYWIERRMAWHLGLGLRAENLRLYVTPPDELAHYAKAGTDIQYRYPFGWSEYEGVASRSDYDLRRHIEASGESLAYFDEETREHIVPYVVEPAVSIERILLALLCDAYDEEPDNQGTRVVLRLSPKVAPVKVAVLPLAKKEPLTALARETLAGVRRHWIAQYDETGNIGRRYRRQDEIGTPFCVTIDFDSLEDRAATVRDRDSMTQERVPLADLVPYLREKIEG